MLDLAFLAFIGYVLVLGIRRPFLWVLLYVYIDILAPQRIGYSIIASLPVSLIAFAAAFGGWLALDRKEGARFTVRQGLMLALLVYCWWTTGNADFPEAAATKWDWVWKALLFAIFLPLTLTTRARIEGLALVLVLAIATIVIGTGMKTVLGGGGYENLKFFVNDNSGIYESSTLATVAIGLIPMIWWFVRHGTVFRPHWTVTAFAAALTFACLLVPIGTEARTGLLCIAALGVLMLRYTRRRLLFIAGAGVLGLTALPFLPQSYYERMATIAAPGGDESASTRVAVWEWTIDYAADKPFGGGFDAFRGNRFSYTMPVKEVAGNTTTVEYREVVDEGRAFHSSIFEMLGEQGWPGLAIWLTLHGLGLWQMERIQRRWRGREDEAERWIAPFAAALQMGAVIYIVGALFQGIAYQPVMLMLVGLQIGLHSYCQRIDSARALLDRSTARKQATGNKTRGAVTA
ncbi:MAG: putative O-glycosylation ligase, exosortase A system-associated [Alphaproteobacteria bacterium HGW-Alphaproteobacteria-14]|nr:MAG: putative O-glycosylation ligase, exosortase A system-associated [Alphaproteobacteria bacterium HGW-Alphaproteobacteria-14]